MREERHIMKKFELALVLGIALFFTASGISAYAFDDKGGHGGKDDHDRISAMDMSAMGLVAASMTGAGIYMMRRRRSGGR